METLRFARSKESRALGRATYFLLLIVMGAVLAMPAAGLGAWAARNARAGEPWDTVAPWAAGLGVWLLTGWTLWRSFRRRAYGDVVLGPEHMETGAEGERIELPYAEVESVRFLFEGWEPTVEARAVDGRSLRLPPDLVPIAVSMPALKERLLPVLQARLERMIAGGTPQPLVERRGELPGVILQAAALALGSPALLLAPRSLRDGWTAVARRLGCGLRALRPPLVVDRDGVRLGEGTALAPWEALVLSRLDDAGLVLRSADGRIFTASSLSDNFWPLSRIVKSRVAR